jgi:hypothetical protein
LSHNAKNIASFDFMAQLIEAFVFVVVCCCHNLNFVAVSFQINEKQLSSCQSNAVNSTSNADDYIF